MLLGFLGTWLENTETMCETKLSTLCAETFFFQNCISSVINKEYVTVLVYVHFEVTE